MRDCPRGRRSRWQEIVHIAADMPQGEPLGLRPPEGADLERFENQVRSVVGKSLRRFRFTVARADDGALLLTKLGERLRAEPRSGDEQEIARRAEELGVSAVTLRLFPEMTDRLRRRREAEKPRRRQRDHRTWSNSAPRKNGRSAEPS